VEKGDSELVQDTLRGVLSSYEVLVRRYEKLIYSHSLRILKRAPAAEDATQEVFLRAFQKLITFDSHRPFKPWLYQIATNYCLDYIRKNARLTKLENTFPDNHPSLIEKLAKSDEIKRLRSALNKLPRIYFQPVWGYYFLELDYQRLAKSLNIPVNTLRTRLKRGKASLYKMMVEYEV